MENNPLVSILIPNYNKAPYLREALDSVLNQTYTNWECIIVDDHSTDGSWEILEEYVEKDSRFQLYKRPDERMAGGNAARNYAFEMSRGKYINWLDSDDVLDSKKIQYQIEQLVKIKNVKSISISNWGRFVNVDYLPKVEIDRYKNYPKEGWRLLIKLWSEQLMIAPFSYLISAGLVKFSGLWDENVIRNQDGEFFSRVLKNVDTIYYSNFSLGYYRDSGQMNVSKRIDKSAMKSLFLTYQSYEETISDVDTSAQTNFALIINYESYLLRTIEVYPDLAKLAWVRINKLKNKNLLRFNIPQTLFCCYLIGFNNTVDLRRILKRLKVLK